MVEFIIGIIKTDVVMALIKIAIILNTLMGLLGWFVLLERWMAAWVQDRWGPNRVGIPLTNIQIWGLGQPIADGVKFALKEGYTPGHVDKWLYWSAPVIMFSAAMASFAVIPFGTNLVLPSWLNFPNIPLVVAPQSDVGLVYIFALSGLAVYGVIVGGWSSNNKYSFLGGLRASAQLIAYEIPLGLAILGIVLWDGSLNITDIINRQGASGVWNVFIQPLGFLVFFIAAMAEAARLPFDLPEAEQELIGGYHTEYTGMKLALLLASEFFHMFIASFLSVQLFFGGWHFWGLTEGGAVDVGLITTGLRLAVLFAKVMVFILLFMLIRWSWPRFRFDQLMDLAWKVMLPLGMLNLLYVAVVREMIHTKVLDELNAPRWAMLAVCGWTFFMGVIIITALLAARAEPVKEVARPGSLEHY